MDQISWHCSARSWSEQKAKADKVFLKYLRVFSMHRIKAPYSSGFSKHRHFLLKKISLKTQRKQSLKTKEESNYFEKGHPHHFINSVFPGHGNVWHLCHHSVNTALIKKKPILANSQMPIHRYFCGLK